MTGFNESRWAQPEFSREYRDNADIFIVERRRMHGIMKSFYRHFMPGRNKNNILDLGCGDGILTQSLMELDDSISSTLVDPSADMLRKARDRFSFRNNIRYVMASFQDLLREDIINDHFDFIVSSLAIHHLVMDEKRKLFDFIYSRLNPGGHFMNMDVVLAPDNELEHWYMRLWNEWMDEKKAVLGIERDLFSDITRRYKEYNENKPDTLDDQLSALKEIGFKEVDCYYKYGIFTMYGGVRAL